MPELPPGFDPAAVQSLVDAQDAEIRRKFGFMAWALDLPEVGDLLRKGAVEGWDEATFRGALYGTQWWKDHGQSQREFDRQLSEDPATARRNITAKRMELRNAASIMGIKLDDSTEFRMAVDALKFAWGEQELQSALAGQLSFEPEGEAQVDKAGTVAQFMSKLNELESDYLVHISPQTKNDFVRRYAEGSLDEGAVANYFLTQAKSRRPYLAEQLDQGITTKNYFAPYIEQTAKLLEVSPGEIDLLDNPKYAKMTEMAGEDGKVRPMTLYEAGRYVRGLDDYKRTGQAADLGASYSEAILRTFGEVA